MSVLKPLNEVQVPPVAPTVAPVAPTVAPVDSRVSDLNAMFTKFESHIGEIKTILVAASALGLTPPGMTNIVNTMNKVDEAYLWMRNLMHGV